jgi:hypothetical protein
MIWLFAAHHLAFPLDALHRRDVGRAVEMMEQHLRDAAGPAVRIRDPRVHRQPDAGRPETVNANGGAT